MTAAAYIFCRVHIYIIYRWRQ